MEHPSTHRILKRRAPGGFTLIEMLIVLFIILIISAIIFSGQANFDRTIALNNSAYDIALTMRQAQSFGLSSRAFQASRNIGYGVAFQTGQPTSYLMFADTDPAATSVLPNAHPGDHIYKAGLDGVVQTYALNNGLTISDFCVYTSPVPKTCSSGGLLSTVSISFIRPNSETAIQGCNGLTCNAYLNACVKLTSRSGEARYVAVSRTGQIQAGLQSINSSTCP